MKFNTITLIILIGAILYSTSLIAYQTTAKGSIQGKVVDIDTKQELAGAVITIVETNKFVISNNNGEFVIDNLEPRLYSLLIKAAFYSEIIKTDIRVGISQSTKLTIELKMKNYEEDEIVVTGNKLFETTSGASISSNTLSPEEIRRAPGAAEDVQRMVQALPGVTTATDSRNDLIVRGGSPFENFIMLDGIEVPNVNHFGSQGASGGPIGMINTDFLNNVTFSSGGFAAKYGDKLSSTLDIGYRDGDKNKISGKFDLGIAGAGFDIEGPIQKDKSSFLFSARKSYLDLILSAIGLTAVPNYSNFNLKVTYELNEQHKLELLDLAGIDDIYFKNFDNEDSPEQNTTKYSGWQNISGIVHKWLIDNNTYLQTSISHTIYEKQIKVDSLDLLFFKNNSVDQEFVLRSDFFHRFTTTDLFEVGFTARRMSNKNDLYSYKSINSFGRLEEQLTYNASANAEKYGAFIQYNKGLFKTLSLTFGLRYDYFNFINKPGVTSPRFSASYQISNNIKLNLAYGIYYQAPPLIWLIADTRNKDLKQMKAIHKVLGVEYYPSNDIKLTIEVYQKDYSDYASSVINPQVSYANSGTEYGTAGLEYLMPISTGKAKGIEVFVQKKLTDKIYFLVNYSYSDIRFNALDGIERPSSFDYRNVFTIIVGYKYNDDFEISGKYRYMGGRPYTPFNEYLSTEYNKSIFDFNSYNNARFNAYQRFDIRADWRFEFSGWNIVTFIDLENVLNTKNVDQLIWNAKKNKADKIYQWTFIPAGGIKIEF
ncbi:MAG: TonB-dependent receptor [bacterium]